MAWSGAANAFWVIDRQAVSLLSALSNHLSNSLTIRLDSSRPPSPPLLTESDSKQDVAFVVWSCFIPHSAPVFMNLWADIETKLYDGLERMKQ